MNILQFEQMALEAVKASKITDFDKLYVQFTKWSTDGRTSVCRVCIYPKIGDGQSGESTHPMDAIKEAVMKLERQQNPEPQPELTNDIPVS